jgi:hypothetical protein
MKSFLLLVLCIVSSATFADTTDVRTLLVDGLEEQVEVNLSTEKTRTEYRTVRVPSTCYRTEYRQRCTTRPPQCRQVCRNGNCRNVCRPGGRTCRSVPVSVPYGCMRTETRSYQVHDYYVDTNVKFIINTDQVSNDVAEKLTIKVRGENSKLSVKGSKNYFIVLDKRHRNESRDAGVKYVDLTYNLNLIPASKSKTAFADGIKNVKLRKGVLNFSLGEGFNLSDFTQQIKIFKNKRLGTDRLLLKKDLNDTDVNVQVSSDSTNLSVDLNSLGIKIPSKIRVILNSSFNIDESKLLNKGEIKTDASANWVFR